MDQKKILNKILPADDLYWNEVEQKYVAISSKQLKDVILKCVEQGILETKDIVKMTDWVTNLNVANILLKNFLKGSINLVGFDELNEPIFGEN